MKIISLSLISLNFLLSPAIALAESPKLQNATIEAEQISQVDSETEPKEAEKKEEYKYTSSQMARLKKLATADRIYLSGYKADAAKFYRQAKSAWELEKTVNKDESIKVFKDPNKLSPAGKVFWRNYQQGKEQQLKSKIFSALNLLTTREPQFLLGHIHYSQMLKQYEREAESDEVLNKAVSRYPNEPRLVQARIDAHVAAEEWLDAYILARQFALFNPKLAWSKKFDRLAEQYLAKYQSELKEKITLNAVGNAIIGTVGFALTGNLFGPLSALETTSMLLQGESAMGKATANQVKQQLPLIKDPEITQYVDQVGQRVAAVSGRDEFNYEFYVIMDDSINAFALPGGKIFVHAGAIMKTDSEAELAGLLAHEVAHAALSHGFQLVTQGNLTANIVGYIPYVGNAATSLIVMNYSRRMEKQADIYGTRILVNAGYAADGVRNLMAQLHKSRQQKENSEPPAWLSTHPNSEQRIRYMEELIVNQNLNRYAYEGVARHQEIRHLVRRQWQEYEKCAEDVVTIEAARECVPNQDKAESAESKPDRE